jgi:hypothetical protein
MSSPSCSSRGIDGARRQQEVKLFVPYLKQILRIELNRRVPRQVQDTFDKAAILADDIKREPTALKVVEYAGVVARDIHSATEAGEIHIYR